jgi:urea transport system permease protein
MSATQVRRVELLAVGAIAFLLIVVVPFLHAQGAISTFTLGVWGKYLCYALLAISVDLLWGFTGLLSLGQALFFTLGGYMHGMYLMRMIGDLGQYKKPIPDFLVFLGWERLPAFWEPFASFPFALTMVFLVPGLLAYVFGYLAFRSRIKGVYFSILTQALTYAATLMFFRNDFTFGGNNGFTDFKFILGTTSIPATKRALYIATGPPAARLPVLPLAHHHQVRPHPAGHPRQREPRPLLRLRHHPLQALRLRPRRPDRGLGGALYVPAGRHHQPQRDGPRQIPRSRRLGAVGGRGTLLGPIVGAISVNALKSYATRAFRISGSTSSAALHPRGALPARRARQPPGSASAPSGPAERPAAPAASAATPVVKSETSPMSRIPILSSRTSHKTFEGFKAISNLTSTSMRANSAPSSAPTAPARAPCSTSSPAAPAPTAAVEFGTDPARSHRPHRAQRIRDQPPRHRPEIPDALRLRRTLRLGKHLALPPRPRGVFASSSHRIDSTATRSHPRGPPHRRPRRQTRLEGRLLAHGQKQWLEIGMLLAQKPKPPPRRRTRRRHDRRGNRPHRRTAPLPRRPPQPDRHRTRHGLRPPDRPQSHRPAPGHRPLRGQVDEVQNDERSARSTSAAANTAHDEPRSSSSPASPTAAPASCGAWTSRSAR